jgi:hypothetical protein
MEAIVRRNSNPGLLAYARHRGIFDLLLERGIEYAFQYGATVVEAYPHTRRSDYMGSESTYRRLGFKPVRKASVRTIMRLVKA